MRVLSVNISPSKEIDFHGQKVRTSIFKLPVEGRRRVGKLTIEGDTQSDLLAHGGEHRAILVYQKDSYDYWKATLRRDDLHYGQFGENFTVEGLADHEVCIGDRFQIGTAIFEVTQPRVTCFKVGISLGVPEMPALLVAHKRPGFYFRVIQEGEVGAGDAIIKLSTGAGAMSVVTIDALLYSNVHPKDRLRQALQIEALSEGWKGSFRALYEGNSGLAPAGSVAAWPGFIPFVIRKIVTESLGVRSFELAPGDGRTLPLFSPGQHIVVKIPASGGSPLIRMYSLCGPAGQDHYRIAVKEEPNGQGSAYLHHHLQAGDHLEVSAPRGTFLLGSGERPLVLLGAGIGITPLLAMLYASVGQGRTVWWIYSTQNSSRYPFLGEVARVLGELTNCHHQTIYSRPAADELQGRDFDLTGRLSLAVLRQLGVPLNGDYYLCGPSAYLSGVSAALGVLGVADSAIHYERFGDGSPGAASVFGAGVSVAGVRPPHLPSGPAGEGPLVSFARSRIAFKWHPRFRSLLEAAEACDVPVMWSCRSGVCHRCETALFAGSVDYFVPPMEEPVEGNVLICCSAPRTDVELDL